MFDKNPSSSADNFGVNSNSSAPTSPPIPPRAESNQAVAGQGVEDIFSPVSSGERIGDISAGSPLGSDNSIGQGGLRISGGEASASEPNISRGLPQGIDPIKSRSGGKKGLVLFLVLIIVAAGGVGAWYYMNNFMLVDEVIEEETTNENINEAGNINPGQDVNVNENTINENVNVNMNDNADDVVNVDISKDSDSDGLTDEEEGTFRTNPYLADSDRDGLTDKEEINIYLTNPLSPDTDKDGYNDGMEVKSGYNPNGQGVLGEIQGEIVNQ